MPNSTFGLNFPLGVAAFPLLLHKSGCFAVFVAKTCGTVPCWSAEAPLIRFPPVDGSFSNLAIRLTGVGGKIWIFGIAREVPRAIPIYQMMIVAV